MKKSYIQLMYLLVATLLMSCAVLGPEGHFTSREPLQMSDVAGAYEGTGPFFYYRLELYADGTGMWAARELSGNHESDIEIGTVISWKTRPDYEIELQARHLSEDDEIKKLTGVFLAGILHLGSSEEDWPEGFKLHLMREVDLVTSRGLLKQVISNTYRNRTQPQNSADE